MTLPNERPFNTYFDHTLLKPEATPGDIDRLCEEAIKYSFYSVCVNSCYVAHAVEKLRGSSVKVTSVIGFPLGAMESGAKAFETEMACENGAEEIDMVINVGALKDGNEEYVREDIAGVATMCYRHDVILKVIIETCLLTDEEILLACRIAEQAGADFVKTSTGFASLPAGSERQSTGATVRDIELMRSALSSQMRIKASGGIHTLADALALIHAGAGRLGCSASVNIMEEYLNRNYERGPS